MKLLEEYGLNKQQISKFQRYLELLLEWNEKFNLTAITDKDEIEEKHFIDSIELVKFFDVRNKTLLDVGSGAGFPGIPLAIVEPTLSITLLESNGKRVSFLREVVKELELKNVEIIQGRSEELGTREKYDIVTARAVKELNVLLEITFYLVKVGGYFIAYKSTGVDEEILNAKHAFKCLQIDEYKKFDYFLPKSKNSRVFLGILKKNKTQKKYPRRYGEITKQPL
ncbi:MAG: 16S rRNA (guanine(527)-N(7))-methyltransferase RsmG [Bacilli bacterium]|nr:16S rRNA (guanine(527)-N(7))-methyltransferase RsmG [Bacilli bacterium]